MAVFLASPESNQPSCILVDSGMESAMREAEEHKLPVWSHPLPPPRVGHFIRLYRGSPKMFGLGLIVEYAVEHGFLYAVCTFSRMPDKYGQVRAWESLWSAGPRCWRGPAPPSPLSSPTR